MVRFSASLEFLPKYHLTTREHGTHFEHNEEVQGRNLVSISPLMLLVVLFLAGRKELTMLLSGAGIGGLTLAVALMRYSDIDVEIFEGAKHIGEVGAGIGVYPRELLPMQ